LPSLSEPSGTWYVPPLGAGGGPPTYYQTLVKTHDVIGSLWNGSGATLTVPAASGQTWIVGLVGALSGGGSGSDATQLAFDIESTNATQSVTLQFASVSDGSSGVLGLEDPTLPAWTLIFSTAQTYVAGAFPYTLTPGDVVGGTATFTALVALVPSIDTDTQPITIRLFAYQI
jgi:hypothetical protein